MIDFIIISMMFISAWLLTVQIFKIYSENNYDVKMANSFKFNVEISEYIKYKKFGKLIAYVDDSEYEFIDDDFYFSKIINDNIGKNVIVYCISNIEGIILFSSEFHLYNIEEKSYKHFDKFI